jgi:predicted DNA-binding transcriptional regulator YafY
MKNRAKAPAGRMGRGYSRPPLARIMRLHELLTADRYPNCSRIAAEFGVSAKTVQRDVNFMREEMGLPVEYEKTRFGFHYTRAVTEFPVMSAHVSRTLRGVRVNPWRKSLPGRIGNLPELKAAERGVLVRIRFDAESARAARDHTWHPTQVTRPWRNGCLEMTLRIGDEWEIARWILGWAGHAWVIEPDRLRNRLREIALEILVRH